MSNWNNTSNAQPTTASGWDKSQSVDSLAPSGWANKRPPLLNKLQAVGEKEQKKQTIRKQRTIQRMCLKAQRNLLKTFPNFHRRVICF